ncbi:hypothetical protein CORC01_05353 [Colletotrichum orchidophilum]|uniref:Uncharacterized protein n=1 Tax=Colletotrichum orchidophilum TaxID=1209926 RepID=A0A1G4BDA1_9PEZI|nr:uncharacterized protein CORC01_05353 [Colletotrichum orchidophilum]OHE99312.1 hypothetical protein CORC01_05353 [Colletotrichum orchidophilum]
MVARKLSHFVWLVDHGANPELQVPGLVAGFTTTHAIMHYIKCGETFDKFKEPLGGATERLLQDPSFVDDCLCKPRDIDAEERQELWEEDALSVKKLHALLPEFEDKLAEMGCGLYQFFETYWKDRMVRVLAEMREESLSEENIEGIRELGILLTDEDDESDVSEFPWTSFEQADTERCIRELDALME